MKKSNEPYRIGLMLNEEAKMDEAYISKQVEVIVEPKKNLTKTHRTVNKKEIPKYMDRDLLNQKINAIDNDKHRMYCLFLWISGVRVTESISIKKSDINFEMGTITLRWLKNRKYTNRNAPMHSSIQGMLRVYVSPLRQDEYVFPYTRQRAFQVTKKYLGISPHQLRHSFAVNWLRSGGDVVTLHRILGHSKIQTTMEYLKIVPVDQSKELEKIKFW